MTNKVHYFSFYLSKEMENERELNPASFPKVEYVKSSVVNSGAKLNLISTALAKVGKGFLGKSVIELSENERHIYLPSVRFPRITVFFMWIQIVKYVFFNVKKNDKVLLYHSLLYIEPFNFIRKFKKFKLILEFNDLYHVVYKQHSTKKEKELAFIRDADAYLFMNPIAEKKFNNKNKPYAISYGNYFLPKKPKGDKSVNSKVHIVYAGIIESGRKAAELAAKSSRYLDDRYVVNILGFGNEQEMKLFKEMVTEINKEKGYDAVIFHGKLRGEEFTNFLHLCHIGVSSHAYSPDEMDSANYTFPSKIATYMSHDLKVVSPSIPCVTESPFSEFTTFYNEHTPQEIAKAIEVSAISVTTKEERSPVSLIKEMDKEFQKTIKEVLY